VRLLWGASMLSWRPGNRLLRQLLSKATLEGEQRPSPRLNGHELMTLMYAAARLQGAPAETSQQAWHKQQLHRNRLAWQQEWAASGSDSGDAYVPPYPATAPSLWEPWLLQWRQERQVQQGPSSARHGGSGGSSGGGGGRAAPPLHLQQPLLHRDALARLMQRGAELAGGMPPQRIILVLWSAVWLGHDPSSSAAVGQLLGQLQGKLAGSWRPVDASMLFWVLGRTAAQSDPPADFMAAVCAAAQPLLPGMTARELVKCLWGLSRLRPCAGSGFEQAALGCWARAVPAMPPQQLALSLSSIVRLGWQVSVAMHIQHLHCTAVIQSHQAHAPAPDARQTSHPCRPRCLVACSPLRASWPTSDWWQRLPVLSWMREPTAS